MWLLFNDMSDRGMVTKTEIETGWTTYNKGYPLFHFIRTNAIEGWETKQSYISCTEIIELSNIEPS